MTADTALVQAGQCSDKIYLILDGLLAMLIVGSDEVHQKVSQFKAGKCVGLLTFINGRSATTAMTAITPSQLVVV